MTVANLSYSTMTAAKVSAACVSFTSGHTCTVLARGATTCQMYMRRFKDGDTITVEPWRSAGFPVIRDLMVDRSAYDKIMQAGGYVSVNRCSSGCQRYPYL